MDRSPAMGKTVSAVVNWEEVSSTNRRGRKEVRYYLKRRDGTSDLAVVGKEKKLGHHTKTTSSCSYRYRYAIRENSLYPSKLRSRQEVIDWLNTLVTEFLWVGSASTCRKKRKHYEAYTRSGIRISAHDFVYVLAEDGKRLIAYLDDLYEDFKGNKMAAVRWFHKVDEIGHDLPKYSFNNNKKEVFISLCFQDLSIKCIDGLATVLSPQHFDHFLKVSGQSQTILDPFVCQYQIDNEVVKPFDITQVKGYWNQNILKFISDNTDDVGINRPRKRLRRLVTDEFSYKIGSEIEVLSQDSGIRGLWFKASVIKKHNDKIKVRYQDIKDAVDESVNLEEWILSSRIAEKDQLGIRLSGRTMIRPIKLCKKIDFGLIEVGCVVDAWLHNGWWEGIVIHKDCDDDKIHVFFPDEKRKLIFGAKDLRYSEEWVGNEWKEMKNRRDLVGLICETNSNSGVTEKEAVVNVDHGSKSKGDLTTCLTWNWSTKKRRCYASNDSPSPFCASQLTSLVMSR